MLRLIDPKAEREIPLSGSVVSIRQLTLVEKQRLGWIIDKYREGDNLSLGKIPYEELIPLIGPAIVKLDGNEVSGTELLFSFESAADLYRLAAQIMNFSSLSEDERKNSGSSSEPPEKASAGLARKNVKREKRLVSSAEKD